jgi:protocatechuate 4,5-dioxygenase alpha chain
MTQGTTKAAAEAARDDEIVGTPIFGPELAQRGYALNKLCFSFNDAANRDAFVKDEAGYCARYGVTAEQTEALLKRDLLKLLELGGNSYYLTKFTGIFGLNMQDIGAMQTGLTVDEFKAKLLAAAED